ncbi:UNVERIFIED_CONTAM: coproporphyrinogen III oxidase, partial [Salmonella enterica subsp. enterica serovar Weltevreden]
LALFHYAHVPWLKPAQKLIDQDSVPDSATKLAIFELAIDDFLRKGYRYIGMDHFARPGDELSLAQQQRSLRRNFMGYTTQAGTDLYGFGVS